MQGPPQEGRTEGKLQGGLGKLQARLMRSRGGDAVEGAGGAAEAEAEAAAAARVGELLSEQAP